MFISKKQPRFSFSYILVLTGLVALVKDLIRYADFNLLGVIADFDSYSYI